ncbi:hypothetical protein AVDCRST_MAG94-1840 [uncultured Leptolyngbya sp.]|uniref:Uncharacterized protein n=1 Tax=uncultured Leptolyngbya sp. TaxID=332963 RepID=A0A6J4LCF3_9CYAN|nr:hypothetical protein AVDCRST_MAG94-1840 [uncultured Leptolyngbya sp.]
MVKLLQAQFKVTKCLVIFQLQEFFQSLSRRSFKLRDEKTLVI